MKGDLRALPKTDLHVHLEGTIRPATLAHIAERRQAPLPSALRGGRWQFSDFADFIRGWTQQYGLLRDPENFERIAYEWPNVAVL